MQAKFAVTCAGSKGGGKVKGKIRTWGVSNMGPQLISLFSRAATPPRINQLELSLDARGFVESAMNVPSTSRAGSAYPGGTVEYCMDRGIDVQI